MRVRIRVGLRYANAAQRAAIYAGLLHAAEDVHCDACGGSVYVEYGRLVCAGDCQNDEVPELRWDRAED